MSNVNKQENHQQNNRQRKLTSIIIIFLLTCLIFYLNSLHIKQNHSNSNTKEIEQFAMRVTEGTSKDRILFKLLNNAENSNVDLFEINKNDKGDKVIISGNSKSALTTGFNWYLKYIANIHISWNNLTQELPSKLPLPKEKIKKETKLKDRYYLNYCTFSYSMAFWDWSRWEKELDWMALHGINMPLSITGIESVWYNLLERLGYSETEINEFISGPAFLAWWHMNNLEGWGGPNPKSWYKQQAKLQKKIIKRMHKLGMKPVFPGYSGMVPHNINEKTDLQTEDMGNWCTFKRPNLLSPEDKNFQKIAALYYEELEKLYGKTDYYSMDPFHEGGRTEGVDLEYVGKQIMSAMKKANPNAKWVVQSWQANPREKMIDSLDKGDIIALDLYCDRYPRWGDPESPTCRKNGFGKHNWIYCMLLNFGGNVGLHGRIDKVINGYYKALGDPKGQNLCGVGTTPEGIENNPIMYELLYELPWRKEKFNSDNWLKEYLIARYGGTPPEQVFEAWETLKNTVYNMPVNYPGQGTVESVFCARPNFHIKTTSSWGGSILFYSPDSTAKANRLMHEAKNEIENKILQETNQEDNLNNQSIKELNRNFEYDLIDIERQKIADEGNRCLENLSNAYDKKDLTTFIKLKKKFLELILEQNDLLSKNDNFKVSSWLEMASNKGNNPQEKNLYIKNAAQLITVWGNREASERGGLHEYSHREWNGILKDLYYKRWKLFLDAAEDNLKNNTPMPKFDWFSVDSSWVNSCLVDTQCR